MYQLLWSLLSWYDSTSECQSFLFPNWMYFISYIFRPGISQFGCVIQYSLQRCRMSHCELRVFVFFSHSIPDFAVCLQLCCFLEDLHCFCSFAPQRFHISRCSACFSQLYFLGDENLIWRAISHRLKSREHLGSPRVNMAARWDHFNHFPFRFLSKTGLAFHHMQMKLKEDSFTTSLVPHPYLANEDDNYLFMVTNWSFFPVSVYRQLQNIYYMKMNQSMNVSFKPGWGFCGSTWASWPAKIDFRRKKILAALGDEICLNSSI